MRVRAATVCVLVLIPGMWGCASEFGVPEAGLSHAANPDAAQAPLAPESDTLRIDAANLPNPRPPAHGQTTMHHEMPPETGAQSHTMEPGVHDGGSLPPPVPPPASQPRLYTCPMHPEVVTKEPGRCPKCGITLIPREAKKP